MPWWTYSHWRLLCFPLTQPLLHHALTLTVKGSITSSHLLPLPLSLNWFGLDAKPHMTLAVQPGSAPIIDQSQKRNLLRECWAQQSQQHPPPAVIAWLFQLPLNILLMRTYLVLCSVKLLRADGVRQGVRPGNAKENLVNCQNKTTSADSRSCLMSHNRQKRTHLETFTASLAHPWQIHKNQREML